VFEYFYLTCYVGLIIIDNYAHILYNIVGWAGRHHHSCINMSLDRGGGTRIWRIAAVRAEQSPKYYDVIINRTVEKERMKHHVSG
jgi:hypothetical protein